MPSAATISSLAWKRCAALWAVLGLSLAAAGPAAAIIPAFNWLLPAGGETWTAGTTHTVEWTGGPPSASIEVHVIRITPFQDAGAVELGAPNDGFASWNIPSNFPPGTYQMYIADTPLTTYAYGQIFTIQPGPGCAAGGVVHSVSFPYTEPPTGVCGQTQADALVAAQLYTQALLATACPNGYYQDPSSAIFDLTILPVGVCLAGYTGAYVAEGSAVVCCYPNPVPSESKSWGQIKAFYR